MATKTQPSGQKIAFSVKSAAAALDLSERTLRRQIEMGELRAAKVGTRIIIRAVDVDAFLARKMT